MRRRGAAVVGVGSVLLATACAASPQPRTTVIVEHEVTVQPEVVTASPGDPDDWSATLDQVGSGVVEVETTDCDGNGWTGTGTLVASDLVLTAAHVAADADEVDVVADGTRYPASVVVWDPSTDIAVLRTEQPLAGHVFTLATRDPEPGTPIAVVGYPGGGPRTITVGAVSAVGQSMWLNDYHVHDEMIVDAAVNHGNSGGPVLTHDGTQVGVVSGFALDTSAAATAPAQRAEGEGYVVSATVAAAAVASAAGATATSTPVAFCGGEVETGLPAVSAVDDDLSKQVATLLGDVGTAIDSADYPSAFARFTLAEQARLGGLATWSDGVSTSTWLSLSVGLATATPTGADAPVELDTSESTGAEPSCRSLSLIYHLVPADGDPGWLIDGVTSTGSVDETGS